MCVTVPLAVKLTVKGIQCYKRRSCLPKAVAGEPFEISSQNESPVHKNLLRRHYTPKHLLSRICA
jgi:hypothetical protein